MSLTETVHHASRLRRALRTVDTDRSIEDLEVLLALRRGPALGLVHLAEQLDLSRWQLRRALGRLDGAGLIEPLPHPDARQRHYTLTRSAHRLLDSLQKELSRAAAVD